MCALPAPAAKAPQRSRCEPCTTRHLRHTSLRFSGRRVCSTLLSASVSERRPYHAPNKLLHRQRRRAPRRRSRRATRRRRAAATDSSLLAALASTALLYALVFAACAANLRGRRRMHAKAVAASAPVLLSSIVPHPLGSALERWVHRAALASSAASAAAAPPRRWRWCGRARRGGRGSRAGSSPSSSPSTRSSTWRTGASTPGPLAVPGGAQAAPLAHPRPPAAVGAADERGRRRAHAHAPRPRRARARAPRAGARALGREDLPAFPRAVRPRGVRARGRCFGPAPWLTEALGIELRAADHQRHHVQGSVNFSKRFSLFDRLFGTWADGPRPRGLKVIDLAEAPADAYPVD